LGTVFTIITPVIGGTIAVLVEVIATDLHPDARGRTPSPLPAHTALVARAALRRTLPLVLFGTASALFVGAAIAVVVSPVTADLGGGVTGVARSPDPAPTGLGAVATIRHARPFIAIGADIG
jgi:hypothetical protein